MAGLLWRFLLLTLLYHCELGPRYNNNTDHALVFQGDADYIENPPLLSFDTILESERSFVHDGRDPTPLPTAEVRVEIDSVQESVWPSFTDLTPVFHQTQERFRTYLREILNLLGFGLGAQDHTMPYDIDKLETVVAERSFVHDSQDSTPLPSAEVLVEINSVQESVWPSITDLKPVFHQTQECFRTYLRELLSQLGFGLGAQDHTTLGEIDEAETVVAETSFVHNGQDSTPLPSAEVLVEIDPVQESISPVFTDLKSAFNRARERFRTYLRKLLSQLSFGLGAQDYTTSCEMDKPAFHRTRKRFRTYLRKLLSQLGFGLGAQDYTTSCEIDEAETIVEETTFVHNGQDSTPLPSAEVRVEIDPVQESVWPSFTDLKPVFHQTQERFRTYLRELLSQLGFGLGAQDHTTPCEIDEAETVVAETSFVHNGQDSTPLPSAEGLVEIDPVQESISPVFTDLKSAFNRARERFRTYLRKLLSQLSFGLGVQDYTTSCEMDKPAFHRTRKRFRTYLRKLLSQLGFGLGAQDYTTSCGIDEAETIVEETTFVHNGQDSTPLPSAEVRVEINPVQESVWPSFTDLKPVFHQTQERFRTYLRELLSQLGFGLGAQDHSTPSEIEKAETVVEGTSFVHNGQDSTPLPSAEVRVESDSVQESVWPSFTDLKLIFHQTQESYRTYLREILSRLGFGLGAQDHTTPCEIDEAETVVEETSFVHDSQDSTPLPSAEVRVEIDSVQESVWPSFTDLKPDFHQTQERFHTYLREILSRLGFGLGAQDHTTPCEIEKDETVVEETTVVHDSQDSTPLPSAEVRVEIDSVQESVWPVFTDLKPVFHQTQERLETYLREILSRLGFGLGAQDHTTLCEIEKDETVVEETSFVHNGQDSTPLTSAEVLVEIDPVQESVWPSFTDLKPVFHQTQERFRTYLRELLSQLGFGLGAQDHSTPSEIEKDATVVEETTFVHNGQDSTPLPSAEGLVEIDPVQESVFPDLKSAFNRARERFRTYLRKLLSRLSFGLGAQDYTTPCEMDKPAFHRTRKRLRTYLRKLIGTLWQLSSFLLEWSCLMLSITATVEAVQICPNVFIPLFILKYASRHVEKRPVRVSKKKLEQQEDALAALDQESVEQRIAHFVEQPMAFILATRETQELKPTAGPTLEQQLQDMDRRQEEEDSIVIRSIETRFTEFTADITNQ